MPSGTSGSPDRSIYVLGYPSSGEQFPVGGIPYDPVVVSSLLRWGNYDYATNQTRWDPAEIPSDSAVPATQTLPPSLFLSSRPGWWGRWPARASCPTTRALTSDRAMQEESGRQAQDLRRGSGWRELQWRQIARCRSQNHSSPTA